MIDNAGMIDAVPSAESGVPAFEPHVDAPARPAEDDSAALRPAYDPAAQAPAAFAGAPAAEAPEDAARGAEQYQSEQYRSGPYQPDQYEPEQYRPEAYQPEVYQPEFQQDPQQQFQPEQGAQAPFAEQAEPAFPGQAQPPFAGQPAPANGVAQGSSPEDRLDEVPAEPVEVVLALGANLGDPQATLRAAVMDLDRVAGLQITEVSPLARTAAVGGPEQPDYLNAVVVARTSLAPRGLLHACQAVEYAHGRTREEHWGPRTLDIDIITYGLLTAAADDLEVPHPRAHERAFVLEPWAQLKPEAVLPGLGGGPVAQLAATAEDRQGIRWLALDWLTESNSGADPTGDVEPQPTASHRPYDPPAAPQPAPPAQDQQAPEQGRSPQDQGFRDGRQPGQGPADPYQQQVQDVFPPQDPFQQPQNGASAHPQGFGPDAAQPPQAQVPGTVPPPEEALVPAPQAPVGDHPAARAPHTPPAAPLVPPAVRETAHHDISAEQVPVEPVHPVFAPVRPQPGDVPFAPVHPAPADQQRAQPADDRPAWAPVRSDEHGHRG
ncbi:2-amino-4-hydroxy-6-hydroxymethyldihydropteridine diphosphokinase [Myceligenerans sp. TRM 65318]|uniref:2-amino-4-hydroxy-6-hydroxymethyldihydropteridine diphosphokinase n=2 Tax=Myceligenerans pegani TaxID=2776917 RepID=A0ABR9MUU7_9MICO|nr:2-amino-4-hydroxy-6-hydroxymethyldihydropteridine diphosphokinase [Myceligenerans sp. TRM 65318]MBE3017429.1 2-amino-4-hydroxy-6-hydroxymethyldihydropteridine diphosphokinase [Myceligenerans sp. TRM 65318]